MKNFRLCFLLCAALPLFIACDDDETETTTTVVNWLPDRYKINVAYTETPVDLDNDGRATCDLYEELSTRFSHEPQTDGMVFYDFDDPENYAVVHAPEFDGEARYIDFNFPTQVILTKEDGTPYTDRYRHVLNHIPYAETDGTEVALLHPDNEDTARAAIVAMRRTWTSEFRLDLMLHVYDYSRREWVTTAAWARFGRVK